MFKLHVSLNVTNVERSVDFYRKLFGTEPVKYKPDYAKFDVADPAVNLTMNQADVTPGNALSHLGIQVATTDQVLAARLRLKAAGLMIDDEMGTTCCYALQDKIWVEDPDGHRWEVFHVIDGDVDKTPVPQTACCAN